ncbi:MAG: hypothetical protein Q8M29_05815 [Bacteroidota bacterium]|nr:hypothetical protein [Bacteroidota bacterium]
MKFRLQIILLFFLFTIVGLAQEKEIKPGKPNELDKQYTPDKNSSSVSNGSSSGGTWAGKSNFVKFNFALLARSTFAVFYERKITDGISLQGGLGYCYNKDKAQILFSDGESIYLSDNKSSIQLSEIMYKGTFKHGANPFLSASVRFSYNGLYSGWGGYMNEDRNSYIELGMRYYSHHYNLTSLNNNDYEKVSGGSNLGIRNTCYMITWGYQIETDSKLVTSHEFYTGFGIRRSNYNEFISSQTQDPITSATIITHTKSSVRETAVSPIVTIGYVLGFGF